MAICQSKGTVNKKWTKVVKSFDKCRVAGDAEIKVNR